MITLKASKSNVGLL